MKLRSTRMLAFSGLGVGIAMLQVLYLGSAPIQALAHGLPLYIASPGPTDSQVVAAGGEVRIPVQLRNLSGRRISLWGRRLSCMPAYLDGVPSAIEPWKTAEVSMVVNTTGLNGHRQFQAAISTDDPSQRELPVTVGLDIHADIVVRRVMLDASVPRSRISNIVHITNVPTDRLAGLGSVQPEGWTAEVLNKSGRDLDLKLSGLAPSQQDGDSARFEAQVDMYFQNADVRRVRVIAKSQLTPEKL